jgi:AcrR family transcriptional regulator
MLKTRKSSGVKARSIKLKARPPRRAPRSSQEIMNRIVNAATREFARHGFAGATTAAIARSADVTETQLFRYFDSKAKLFHETIFKPLDEHFERFNDQHPTDSRSPHLRENAYLYISQLQSFIGEHAEMLKSLIVAQVYDDDIAQSMRQIGSLDRYFSRGEAVMMKTSRQPRVDPKLLVRVSFFAVLAAVIFKNWIFPPGMASDAEIRDAINDFVWEGASINLKKK